MFAIGFFPIVNNEVSEEILPETEVLLTNSPFTKLVLNRASHYRIAASPHCRINYVPCPCNYGEVYCFREKVQAAEFFNGSGAATHHHHAEKRHPQ